MATLICLDDGGNKSTVRFSETTAWLARFMRTRLIAPRWNSLPFSSLTMTVRLKFTALAGNSKLNLSTGMPSNKVHSNSLYREDLGTALHSPAGNHAAFVSDTFEIYAPLTACGSMPGARRT